MDGSVVTQDHVGMVTSVDRVIAIGPVAYIVTASDVVFTFVAKQQVSCLTANNEIVASVAVDRIDGSALDIRSENRLEVLIDRQAIVSVAISRSDMPFRKTAIANADIW